MKALSRILNKELEKKFPEVAKDWKIEVVDPTEVGQGAKREKKSSCSPKVVNP
jgi:hypothetical protein